MRKKKVLNKDILILSILTTIVVFTWIGFDIYRVFHRLSPPEVTKDQLRPLNPNFNKETLNSLKKRKIISQEELDAVPELIKFELQSKEASPASTKEASPSAEKET